MGGVISKKEVVYIGKTEKELVNVMMPVYYLHNEPVTAYDLNIAKENWNMILNNTAPGFHALKGTEGFHHASSIMMFYDVFYSRLFDVHPLSRPLFKSGLKSQGKFLVKMIGLSLGIIDEPEKFEKTLIKLTESHNERGIKAIEYGIVGEVLFYTIRQCVGEAYTPIAHYAWRKIMSKILSIMVPIAVSHELHSKSVNQSLRLNVEEEKSEISRLISESSHGSDSENFDEKYGES